MVTWSNPSLRRGRTVAVTMVPQGTAPKGLLYRRSRESKTGISIGFLSPYTRLPPVKGGAETPSIFPYGERGPAAGRRMAAGPRLFLSVCPSGQQGPLGHQGDPHIPGGKVGVEDLHSGGGQGGTGVSPFNDDGHGDLRVVKGGKTD